jgi:nucleotide-binding universal stress UspA family protein
MEIEGPKPPQTQDFRPSLAHVTSVLVLHDGSAQGHRAFHLALDVASRSMATVHLVGLCGVRHDRFEPSDSVEDYHWQRGWLERLAQMYSREAEHGGVEFRTILVAANDQERLCEVLNGDGFDLIVIPRRFADEGAAQDAFSAFHQSLTGAAGSTILFCP